MSDQSADAFMEWTAGIRKMLIEAGEKSAAARVDNYSFETFDAGWQASRHAALEEAIQIIETHKVPIGNSAAGEMAAGWTMDALHEIRDAIRALAGTEK